MTPTDNLLAFDQVLFNYETSRVEALRRLTVSIPPGSTTVILGPNGAGKTTLLHLALGFLVPESGTVFYEGRSIQQYSRRHLGREISLVPQSEHLAFQYSVLEYVTLGRAPHLGPLAAPGTADITIARQAVETVGLTGIIHRDITTLSGGERQLAAIARSIAQKPRLLLLDEPVSHLDLANKIRVLEILQTLAAAGTTLVLSTHEPEVAAAAATHLVLVRAGEVLAAGPAADVLTSTNLSATYGIPVRVEQFENRKLILWTKT